METEKQSQNEGSHQKLFQEVAEVACATYVIHGRRKYQKCLPGLPQANIGYYYILLVLKKKFKSFPAVYLTVRYGISDL